MNVDLVLCVTRSEEANVSLDHGTTKFAVNVENVRYVSSFHKDHVKILTILNIKLFILLYNSSDYQTSCYRCFLNTYHIHGDQWTCVYDENYDNDDNCDFGGGNDNIDGYVEDDDLK